MPVGGWGETPWGGEAGTLGLAVPPTVVIGSWLVLPAGGRPTGPADSGAGVRYPFVDPEPALEGLVADFWLAYVQPASLPLAIAWLYGMDLAVNGGVFQPGIPADDDPVPMHSVDVLVVDAAENVIFDSTTAGYYAVTPFGDRLVVHEWRSGVAACRLVQHVAVARAADARLLDRTIHPQDGRLDARTWALLPSRATALRVDPTIPMAGDLALEAGYNVALTPTTRAAGLRTATDVLVDVVPGTGAGRAPGCTEEIDLRTINGQAPDPKTGNFVLDGAGCYYFRRPFKNYEGIFRVGNDCAPCCDCSDYEAVQAALLAAWDRYASIAALAQAILAQYELALAQWNLQKACRDAHAVRINAIAYGNVLELVATYTNGGPACAHAVVLQIIVSLTPLSSVSLVLDPQASFQLDNSGNSAAFTPTYVAPTPAGAPGTLDAHWATVASGATVAASYRLALAGPGHAIAAEALATVSSFTVGYSGTKTVHQ